MKNNTVIIVCPKEPHRRIDRSRSAAAREALKAGKNVIFRTNLKESHELETEFTPEGYIVRYDGTSPLSHGRGRLIDMSTEKPSIEIKLNTSMSNIPKDNKMFQYLCDLIETDLMFTDTVAYLPEFPDFEVDISHCKTTDDCVKTYVANYLTEIQ